MVAVPLCVPILPRIKRWVLNWRLLLALALNVALWVGIVRAIGEIMR